MEDYKSKPLDLNEQERVLGWERGIKLVMQGHGLEGTTNTWSIAHERQVNKWRQQEHKETVDRYKPYARWYDENVRQVTFWADQGRRTNNPDDWRQYDDYRQRLEVPEGCDEMHNNWNGLGSEYRKLDEFEKKEDRLKKDEQREIEAVGKVMQAIIATTSTEIYRKYAMIIDQPEGDRVKRLFEVIKIVKDTLAGAVSVQKVRWRNKIEAVPMANTIQELEQLMDNLEYIKTSVESEERSYPGSNPFVPQDWKTIFETKISADGDMTLIYGQVLNMPETTPLGEICKKLKTTVIDKYKLKRDQQPTKGLKDELKVLATRMELMEKETERDRSGGRGRRDNNRGRSYDRGRSYSRDRDRGRGDDRGRFDSDRGRNDGGRDRGNGGERGRSRERYGDGGRERGRRDDSGEGRERSKECYEYKYKGQCGHWKRTGFKCKFDHNKSNREEDSGSESERSTDGRALKKKQK
jgi:hypothetical protein